MNDESIDYHLRGFRSAKVVEHLGGIPAIDSTLFRQSAMRLIEKGWTAEEVADAIRKEFDALKCDKSQ